MHEKINYSDAFEELQLLVSEIESGNIPVDQLAIKVKRASLLVKICREQLTSTEADINQILRELEEEEPR